MTELTAESAAMARPDRRGAAVLTVCAAVALSALQDTLLKWLSGSYPFHEMQTIRCLAAMPVVLIFLGRNGGWRAMRTPQLGLALLRSLLLGVASTLFYLTIAAMPLPEAIALTFTMPLLVAALSGPVLGERVRPHRWLAVLVGFLGTLILVRPGAAVFEPAGLLALAAALCYAFGYMLTRPLSATLTSAPLAVYQNLMYLAVALALAALLGTGHLHLDGHVSLHYLTRAWLWPTWPDLALISLTGLSTGLLMVMFTLAYRLADTSFVAPFEYTSMLWAVLLGYLVWHQLPDGLAWCGIGLVIGSGLFMLAMDRNMLGARAG